MSEWKKATELQLTMRSTAIEDKTNALPVFGLSSFHRAKTAED
jgi:hypothetical protein